MLGRFVLLAVCASIGTAAFAASPALESDAFGLSGRLRVTCTGTMITAGQPPPGGPILANGMIDFATRRVRGFGVGHQPITALTAASIAFGSSPPDAAWHGNIIEGLIDRQSGRTHVLVRSPKDPSEVRIELALSCEFERPVS
jgi:hypothetical protein